MRALVFERFGGPEVLGLREVPDPVPGPGEALVAVEAAGLNYADVYRRQGRYHLAGSPPWVLGYEGAGVVRAVGPGVRDVAPGTRVGFADVARANASLVVAPADRLVPLPEGVPAATAAAVLLQGLTAQMLLEDVAPVAPGQWAVVHAAAGGVGLLLVQLLRAAGARVVGLASSAEKREAAARAGAEVVLPAAPGWARALRERTEAGADVVYDSVGTTLPESLEAARTGGTVVFYGFAGGDPAPVDPRILMDRSLRLVGADLWNVLVDGPSRRSRAARLLARVRAGTLVPRVAATVPLAEGADAHRLLEGRGVVGKVVLVP